VKKNCPLLDVTLRRVTPRRSKVDVGRRLQTARRSVRHPTIVAFGNFTISIKPEDEATLKKPHQGRRLLEARRRFQQYAQGQAMLWRMPKEWPRAEAKAPAERCREWEWHGFGMANMFANQQQNNQQHGQQPAPAAGAAPQRSVMDRLKELNELKTRRAADRR